MGVDDGVAVAVLVAVEVTVEVGVIVAEGVCVGVGVGGQPELGMHCRFPGQLTATPAQLPP